MEKPIQYKGLSGIHLFSIPNDPRQANEMKFSREISASDRRMIVAELRYDDTCKNGHRTFSITGGIYSWNAKGRKIEESSGCIHAEIAEHFPELQPLIQWHLVSDDGPMHYAANTVYFAGNSDPWSRKSGKIRQLDAARNAAAWPDATDEELSVEASVLKAKLIERLPRLLEEFHAAMQEIGLEETK